MPYYLRRGKLPPKRHTEHRVKPGYKNEGIYYEEVVTLVGFARAYSIVYHLKPPTRVAKVEAAGEMKVDYAKHNELRHVHLLSNKLPRGGNPVTGRLAMLGNADVIMHRCRPSEPQSELFRNATADEVYFIHKGSGTLHTMFGPLPFKTCGNLFSPVSVLNRRFIRRA